jgi:PII-like signaling protein
MNLSGKVKKLKIVVGETDRVYQRPLFEAIVYAAKKYKIAGATVTHGMMSYGAESMIHSIKIFSLANDLPMVIEMVDVEERLTDFARIINRLIDKSGGGGLMTMEDVTVLRYGNHYEE